jgi:lipopolysaccharide transport system ATP-binding protein
MEEKEVLVKVESLSKKFSKDLKTSLKYGVQDLFSNFKGNRNERLLRKNEFWALKDINFELRRGECLGLIGHNGAGKSTLLKILNGLIQPDAGKVTIKGKVGALIELGAGFNPILTGRENIFNNGAVLGFSRKEIEEKLEAIIDFAEIREFIDMPVQNYSSGMKVRLGFSIAAQMEPDVLIIDEVLAVGDARFKSKCFNILENLISKCAVIIVSHSMPQISRICTDLILMKNGVISIHDKNNLGPAIEGYFKIVGRNIKTEIGSGGLKIVGFLVNGKVGESFQIEYNKNFCLDVDLEGTFEEREISLRLTFFDIEQKPVAQISSMNDGIKLISRRRMRIRVQLPNLSLNIGTYSIHVAIHKINQSSKEGEILHLVRSLTTLHLYGNSYYSHAPYLIKGEWKTKQNPNHEFEAKNR